MKLLLSFVVYLFISAIIASIALTQFSELRSELEEQQSEVEKLLDDLGENKQDLKELRIDQYKTTRELQIERERIKRYQDLIVEETDIDLEQFDDEYTSELKQLQSFSDDQILNLLEE